MPKNFLAEWLYGGVYSETYSSLDDGGEECFNQIANSYRLASSTFALSLALLLYLTLARPRLVSVFAKAPSGVPPTPIEKVSAVLLVLCWCSQFTYKLLAKRLIFMFSPCHQVSLFQLYLCVSPVTAFSRRLLMMMTAWIFGP